MEIKVLGCLSPYPNKSNNCVGYLVDKSILLDCGPGSTKELDMKDSLEGLTIIISHFHKDHYTDLFAIAYASYVYHKFGLLNNKIKVLVPKMNPGEKGYDDYLFIKNLKTSHFDVINYDENSSLNINNYKISFVKNFHSIKTYSVKLQKDSKSLVYAADTGYKSKDSLIKFSENCDCLVIESSLLESDVPNDYHLTSRQATSIAFQAAVKKVLLTHFWPEYSIKLYMGEIENTSNCIFADTGKKVSI